MSKITIVNRPRYLLFRSGNVNSATYYRSAKTAERDMQRLVDRYPKADMYFSLLDLDGHSIDVYQSNEVGYIYHVRQERLVPLMDGVSK